MRQSIRCNRCDAVVPSSERLPAGKKMQCPECRQMLTIGSDEPETAMQSAKPPAPSSKQVRPDDTTDYDDDSADDLRRRKRASLRRKGMSRWLIVAFIAGPIVLALAAAAIGVGTWLFFSATSPQALILGNWQATEPVPGVVVEFHREGTLIVRQDGLQASARYRFLDDKLLELEVPNQAKQLQGMLPRFGRFNQMGPGPFNQAVPDTVKVNVTILTLTRTELVIQTNNVVQRFKRAA